MDFASRLLHLSFLFSILLACVLACRKIPSNVHGRKSAGDNGYRLYLGDEPNGYEPGKIYNCELK